MAWVQADLDRVDTAIASGVKSVTFADGRRTDYQSLDHMIAARRVIQAELSMQAQATSGVVRRRYGAFRSGV